MATHSSILAWRILWTEEPGRLQPMGSQESDTAQQLNHHCTFKVDMKDISEESLPPERQVMLRVIYFVWKGKWPGASKLPQGGK